MNAIDLITIENLVSQMEKYVDMTREIITDIKEGRVKATGTDALIIGLSNQSVVISTKIILTLTQQENKINALEKKLEAVYENMEKKPV